MTTHHIPAGSSTAICFKENERESMNHKSPRKFKEIRPRQHKEHYELVHENINPNCDGCKWRSQYFCVIIFTCYYGEYLAGAKRLHFNWKLVIIISVSKKFLNPPPPKIAIAPPAHTFSPLTFLQHHNKTMVQLLKTKKEER